MAIPALQVTVFVLGQIGRRWFSRLAHRPSRGRAAARRVTRLRGNLKSLRHSQFLLAVRMFWRDRRVARPCRKTYNLTPRTIQARPAQVQQVPDIYRAA